MTKPKAKTLSLKEELFVAAYLANSGNATQAAISAGYSAKSAYAKGSELLKRAHVAAAVQKSKQNITRKFKVNAERVIEEMAIVGFSDIRHYRLGQSGEIELAPGAPDSAMRAVKRFKRKLRVIPQRISTDNPKGEPILEIDSEFELWNKDGELRALGDYLKLFKENRADDPADDDDELTPSQRKERILNILRVAARRRQAAGGKKKAG
jgi:phage terminase small subunit